MALETNTLINGEWTTRILDVNTILRHHNQKDEEAAAKNARIDIAPRLGVLTQTVIKSPVVNWILPVRLRDTKTQDVAFIGDAFVQIKTLNSEDGLLHDVVRKEIYGARIRNAIVIGSLEAYEKDLDLDAIDPDVKLENGDIAMDPQPYGTPPLPPQFIVLQLDTGDSVFLRLVESENGIFKLVTDCYRVSKPMLKLQPGMHLAVDPSSRYMAIGCSESVFALYALHPRSRLKEMYSNDPKGKLKYISNETHKYFHGTILKLEFLYPSPDDKSHIILLMLAVVKGKTRMVVYEWDTRFDLGSNGPKIPDTSIPRSHELKPPHEIPLLLIPLRIRSEFILVCEDSIAICANILEQTPKIIDLSNGVEEPTQFHHGSGTPLWVSWTRPTRYQEWKETRDDIYLAREDGLVKFLEIDSKEDPAIKSNTNIGELNGNCGTAFASMDRFRYRAISADILVTGGNSCFGGTYIVEPRKTPSFHEPIQNWSPAQDFVTTYVSQSNEIASNPTESAKFRGPMLKPSRIFACGGKGVTGAITELRHGLEAKIGFEIDFEPPIMNVWALFPPLDNEEGENGHTLLLSMGDRSMALYLSADEVEASMLDDGFTKLDLRHRTVAATTYAGQNMIQVTEQSVVTISGLQKNVYEADQILRVHHDSNFVGTGTLIQLATIHQDRVLFVVYLDSWAYLQILDLGSEPVDMEVDGHQSIRTLGKFSARVSALAFITVSEISYAIIAEWNHSEFSLHFQPLTEGHIEVLHLTEKEIGYPIQHDAIVSIAVLESSTSTFVLICGTRNGMVITLEVDDIAFTIHNFRCDHIGATSVTVSKNDCVKDAGTSFFLVCDSKAYLFAFSSSKTTDSRLWLRNAQINQIWLTDANRAGLPQPKISSLAIVPAHIAGGTINKLILRTESQLLIVRLMSRPKTVPRHTSIEGTPTRLLYSDYMGVLIVAASVHGRSTLLFIDPDTGEDLSMPIDQVTKKPTESGFVSGLGNMNEKIFRLFEWSYTKHDKIWNFLIASTSTGRVLIMSIHKSDEQRRAHLSLDNAKPRPKIEFYNRYKFRCADPVLSVTGFSEGLIWCAGEKLFCDILDLKSKKFRRAAEYDLPSAAIDLSYKDGTIYALTNLHSLEILRLELLSDGRGRITRTHGDQVSRDTLHQITIELANERPIHLVSDKRCSLVGLWPTQGTRADTLKPVFEAQLPYSITKFRAAKCRPTWDSAQRLVRNSPRNKPTSDGGIMIENLLATVDNSEILGLSINGALSHFTILNFQTWEFLRFLINLAMRSPQICEFTYKDDPPFTDVPSEPKIMMQIDGDMLRPCLEEGGLEALLQISNVTSEASRLVRKFRELLYDLHGGQLAVDADITSYLEQAYTDLRFLLRPVL